MINLETIAPAAREAGVVYTKPWVVELVLDLTGYGPDRRLAELVALEPSAGDGAFLSAMVRRLVESCERHGIPLTEAGRPNRNSRPGKAPCAQIQPQSKIKKTPCFDLILLIPFTRRTAAPSGCFDTAGNVSSLQTSAAADNPHSNSP